MLSKWPKSMGSDNQLFIEIPHSPDPQLELWWFFLDRQGNSDVSNVQDIAFST